MLPLWSRRLRLNKRAHKMSSPDSYYLQQTKFIHYNEVLLFIPINHIHFASNTSNAKIAKQSVIYQRESFISLFIFLVYERSYNLCLHIVQIIFPGDIYQAC